MFDQLKQFASMMGQARQMKEKFEELQARLGEKTVEADAGAGAVRVVANGRLEIVSIHLDHPLLTALAGSGPQTDQAMIEELITAAVNSALTRARAMMAEELRKLGGGFNLPGLDQLMGQG
ncbi:MAG: YbaB/EbfC family nucleoid-associated protein [Phycisphaeraceae bacterium]|nr:YbaB/EbfC family nucleoid-associated protein [Phycisphaeraceae bacterium]